jgi:hypothetical protein
MAAPSGHFAAGSDRVTPAALQDCLARLAASAAAATEGARRSAGTARASVAAATEAKRKEEDDLVGLLVGLQEVLVHAGGGGADGGPADFVARLQPTLAALVALLEGACASGRPALGPTVGTAAAILLGSMGHHAALAPVMAVMPAAAGGGGGGDRASGGGTVAQVALRALAVTGLSDGAPDVSGG